MTSESKKGMVIRFVAVGFAAVLVVIDQLTKMWALENLAGQPSREVIKGLLYLSYVENRGMAFGLFQGKALLLAGVTGAVLLVLLVVLLSGRVVKGGLPQWCLALILAGGTGNLIDRASRGFVVDFIDFSALFNFPIFNFADCCVVIGTVLLICCMVWTDILIDHKNTEEKQGKTRLEKELEALDALDRQAEQRENEKNAEAEG